MPQSQADTPPTIPPFRTGMDSGTWTVACVVQHLRNMVGTGSSYGARGRIAGFKLPRATKNCSSSGDTNLLGLHTREPDCNSPSHKTGTSATSPGGDRPVSLLGENLDFMRSRAVSISAPHES